MHVLHSPFRQPLFSVACFGDTFVALTNSWPGVPWLAQREAWPLLDLQDAASVGAKGGPSSRHCPAESPPGLGRGSALQLVPALPALFPVICHLSSGSRAVELHSKWDQAAQGCPRSCPGFIQAGPSTGCAPWFQRSLRGQGLGNRDPHSHPSPISAMLTLQDVPLSPLGVPTQVSLPRVH